MTTGPLEEELSELVGAFAEHLRRAKRRGLRWVPAQARRPSAREDDAELAGGEVDLELGPAGEGTPETLQQVREALGDCRRCRLHSGRKQVVFGVGDPRAELMFIGEAPGMDEDLQGEPFVGKAGQLLTRMIGAMGLARGEVYIANIIKCRPPQNRNPEPDEVASCEPFLRRQIAAIGPRLIIALGKFAAQTLLSTTTSITRLRGEWRSYQGIRLMPTFHPAYLLRNPESKRLAWKDLQLVMEEMDRLGLKRARESAS